MPSISKAIKGAAKGVKKAISVVKHAKTAYKTVKAVPGAAKHLARSAKNYIKKNPIKGAAAIAAAPLIPLLYPTRVHQPKVAKEFALKGAKDFKKLGPAAFGKSAISTGSKALVSDIQRWNNQNRQFARKAK